MHRFCTLPGVLKSPARAFLYSKPACLGVAPSLLWSCLCVRSTSPLMEEPQLLLHCQRSACARALLQHPRKVWAPAKPATQPRPAQPAHPPPSANLWLPSSIATFQFLLKSRLLILAHLSKLRHSNSTSATSSPGGGPVGPPGLVNGLATSHSPGRGAPETGAWCPDEENQGVWSTESGCWRLASILKLEFARNWVALLDFPVRSTKLGIVFHAPPCLCAALGASRRLDDTDSPDCPGRAWQSRCPRVPTTQQVC